MALDHWTIKVLHAIFVTALGLVALRLLVGSFLYGGAAGSRPKRRGVLLLRLFQEDVLCCTIPLTNNRYRIGRGSEYDIPLKGNGIPRDVGDLYVDARGTRFRGRIDSRISINGRPATGRDHPVAPGDTIQFYGYALKIGAGKTSTEVDDGCVRNDG